MEYRCISADCHLDLCWLPHDLFTSQASNAMKDRMPYVEERPEGYTWVVKSGDKLARANAKGGVGIVGGYNPYVKGEEYRADRMASTGLYDDGVKGIFRPTTPELRLQDQDRDGLQAEVLYGLLNAGNRMKDREAAIEFYRIYNEWLAGFCAHDPKRLVGLASIPAHSVEAAVAETRHAAKLGLGGLDVSISFEMMPLWDPYWDPFWAAAQDADLAVHFHTIVVPPPRPLPQNAPEAARLSARATELALFQVHLAGLLASIIHGGALERFPKLRIVLGESGIGWIPYVLDRMDNQWEGRFRKRMSLSMKPSDYWRRQCRATFQDDVIGTKLLDDLGVENVMWGSDYPHPDGVFPDSQEHISRQFGHLPADVRRKITCENVGKFYKLM